MDVDVEADVDVVEGDDSVMGTSAGVGGREILAGGEAEGAGVGMGMERDSESDEIVRVLEKGLPKWEGFENVGWMGNAGHVGTYLICFCSCTTNSSRLVGAACRDYTCH